MEILLVTRNITSTLVVESKVDIKVVGQIVSSLRVNVVRRSLVTTVEDIELYLAPESKRQRIFKDFEASSIYTVTVGSNVFVFCFKMADRDVLFFALEVTEDVDCFGLQ